MTAYRIALALMLAMATGAALGDCNFDSSGTISNPDDPSCRDVFLTYTANVDSGNNIALGYAVPLPVDSQTPVDGFRTYQSLFERHQSLIVDHPDAIDGQIIGQTLSGRDIWAYKLGDPDAVTHDGLDEPAMLVNGGIHAREWQSPEAVTDLLEYLAQNSRDGGLVQFLSENVNTVLIPVLNVDGFLQTQRHPDRAMASRLQPRDGRMRRKNLRHPTRSEPVDETLQTTDDNFFGVDLNRNHPEGFMNPARSSANPVSLVQHGPNPQSEPESQALVTAATLGPEDRLRFYIDTHSFTQILFTPMTGNVRRDAVTTELASRVRAVSANKYAFGPSNPGTEIGSTDGYFAVTYQIPAWTLETEPGPGGGAQYGGTSHGHAGFVLPATELRCMKAELTPSYILGFYRMAGPAYVSEVVISAADNPADIYFHGRWLPVDRDSRSLLTIANRALIPGDEYRLWLAFSKPMRWRNLAGEVVSFPGQRVAAIPRIALEATELGTEQLLDADRSAWLANANTQPTGIAPDGFARYRDDALALQFTLDPNLGVSDATPLLISVDVEDLSRQAIDANPATVVDWQNGSWSGLENAVGTGGDAGGTDCSMVSYASNNPADTPPGAAGACAAAGPAPPPPLARMASTLLPARTCVTPNDLTPPPVTPPPPAPGRSGGGAALWLLLLLVSPLLRRRVCDVDPIR
ncbi:MAG: hypothetical protein HKN59_01800 [Gammaproteobacteria bacterium]|nr:hypothetical protein [Gammaproteobacteria bacterium]